MSEQRSIGEFRHKVTHEICIHARPSRRLRNRQTDRTVARPGCIAGWNRRTLTSHKALTFSPPPLEKPKNWFRYRKKTKGRAEFLYTPQSFSSELSPQSFAALQICSVRRHTLSFLQRKGLFGGHGNFPMRPHTYMPLCFASNKTRTAFFAFVDAFFSKTFHQISSVSGSQQQKTYHTCRHLHLNCLHSHPRRHTTRPAAYRACCCTWTHLHGMPVNLQTNVCWRKVKWVQNVFGLLFRATMSFHKGWYDTFSRSIFVHPSVSFK